MLEALYIYIENEKVADAIKYGMKLSEYSNTVINKKNGIAAYLSPKDSNKYLSDHYTCVRILIKEISSYIYDKNFSVSEISSKFFVNANEYRLGDFEIPRAIICSTILPENISIYNKILDFPILIENSSEFYYQNFIFDMIENNRFSYYEVYQMLLIYGEQKGVFKSKDISDNLKLYTDIKTNKKYTRKKTK